MAEAAAGGPADPGGDRRRVHPMPVGFCDRNTALDVAPSAAKHACHPRQAEALCYSFTSARQKATRRSATAGSA